MKILLIIVVFLLVGGFLIISNENIKLNSTQNVIHFADLYYKWVFGIYGNVRQITGNVIGYFNPSS